MLQWIAEGSLMWRRRALLLLVVGLLMDSTARAETAQLRRTKKESWSESGYQQFRWGMGPGDVEDALHRSDAMLTGKGALQRVRDGRLSEYLISEVVFEIAGYPTEAVRFLFVDDALYAVNIRPRLGEKPRVLQDLAEKREVIPVGFVGRFIYTLPRTRVGTRELQGTPSPDRGRREYEQRVRDLIADRPPGQATEPICLSPDALQVRNDFFSDIEPRLDPVTGDLGTPGIAEWARKLVGTTVRLAGILHCCQHRDPTSIDISRETMEAAVRLARYLLPHAQAALDEDGRRPGDRAGQGTAGMAPG